MPYYHVFEKKNGRTIGVVHDDDSGDDIMELVHTYNIFFLDVGVEAIPGDLPCRETWDEEFNFFLQDGDTEVMYQGGGLSVPPALTATWMEFCKSDSASLLVAYGGRVWLVRGVEEGSGKEGWVDAVEARSYVPGGYVVLAQYGDGDFTWHYQRADGKGRLSGAFELPEEALEACIAREKSAGKLAMWLFDHQTDEPLRAMEKGPLLGLYYDLAGKTSSSWLDGVDFGYPERQVFMRPRFIPPSSSSRHPGADPEAP